MLVHEFFHAATSTLTYLVYDEAERVGVVIDSVRDFDLHSGRSAWSSAAEVAAFVDAHSLQIPFALDTHAHADHLTGLPFWKERFGSRTAIGADITRVQRTFSELFHLGSGFATDGSQFDLLLRDGQVLDVGPFSVEAIHTPGHTPACMTYRVGDALFVGDTLFMPDSGTARCDFPGGSAERLFDSIQRLYKHPDATRVFVCHDYQPGGRSLEFETTIRTERSSNTRLRADTTRDAYVAARKERDAGLAVPRLLLPAIQVNIRGGEFPEREDNGVAYLKIPVDAL